ncbi:MULTISPECIES: HDOD domain-containing protein [unclassified Pseudomonas]|uniref:HDOD domain-containing protein n=1 Tax=unclassified Pseudomonas TaxID=196821 RepID=UPI0030DBCC18
MQVMIVDDDPWIADLLKQIVLSLRPGIQVNCFGDMQSAFASWQEARYTLVLADWNLPDGSGVSLLQKIRLQDRETPLVMITGRSDRQSVLEVRRLGISAFITKPFDVPRVVACIEGLLPQQDFVATAPMTQEAFTAYLSGLTADGLDLPMLEQVKEQLQLGYRGESLDLRELASGWQGDPSLCVHLIAASNSAAYIGLGAQCTSLRDALRRLGPRTSVNLAMGFALKQVNMQDNLVLSVLMKDYLDNATALAERVVSLAKQCGIEPVPLQTAALLHRIGELCVIYQAYKWENQGNTLDENLLMQAICDFAAPFAIKLKAQWELPMALRELIGAVYALPQAQVRREQVLMRLAAAINNSEPPATVDRLSRLAGLA